MNYNFPISVLLPVFNAERYIREAIKSVLNQTYDNFELMIIDDGSVDNSVDIASEFRDKRIRLFRTNHQGLVRALNFGLERAKGRWIARMDADDVALLDRFKLQKEYLSSHEDAVAVGGGACLIDSEGEKTGRLVIPPNDHDVLLQRILYRGHGPSLLHPTVMMQTDAAKKIGGYRREFPVAEDVDMWLRLSQAGKLHSIPETVLLLRKHIDSVSQRKLHTQTRSHIAAVVCYIVRLKTGVDLITDMPEKWPVCISTVEKAMEMSGILQAGELRINIVDNIRRKTIFSLLSACYSIVRHLNTFVKIFFGDEYHKVSEQAAEQVIQIVRENKNRNYSDT